ncbi:TetR family transcriptional regulator [Ulvibacter antarcticus]|uniref:TetR family transcriptional regulator n=2 Tax=Ulvibacter antarcticus TaxID=442714 RepID=A0A3L9YVU3_9FLAO|nr:TetR family transcriptional regulator [Ulvibacter antarcticus]
MVYFLYLCTVMLKKSDKTTKFIIEKAAPIFSKKGYTATSMADITQATGLTKGAIYGNFVNKEAIAIAAFQKNVNDLLVRITKHQEKGKTFLDKLYLITDFYRQYEDYSRSLGGCPILNIGVDSSHQDTELLSQVQFVINKTQQNIVRLIEKAIEDGTVKQETDPQQFAKMMYTRIQGAIFMSQTMGDKSYLIEATNELDEVITNKLKN